MEAALHLKLTVDVQPTEQQMMIVLIIYCYIYFLLKNRNSYEDTLQTP